MPNWCENDLTITGKEIKKFLEFAKGEDHLIDFNKFIPYPENFKKLDLAREEWDKNYQKGQPYNPPKDGYNLGGYEWCINNWGTKWNACDVKIEEIEEEWEEVVIHFETAWSPPKPVIKKMGEMFPSLTFDLRYFERGAGFHGVLRIERGEVTDDKTGDYYGNRGG